MKKWNLRGGPGLVALALCLGMMLRIGDAAAQNVSGPVTIDIGDGPIPALSWEFAVAVDGGDGGRTSGAPELSALRVTRYLGTGTTALLLASFTANVIDTVKLKQGELTIELESVRVTGLEMQGAGFGGEPAVEVVELSFIKIKVKVGDVEVTYDIQTNIAT